MFGVIVCPRCRRAKGVDLSRRTTTCSCGFEIRVRSVRVHARAGTARELVDAVRRVQAERHGGLQEYERVAAPRRTPRSRSAHARVAAAARSAGDRSARVRAAARGLTEEIELFTVDDLRRVLDALGIPGAQVRLEELVASNVVYEPREGYYRAVRRAP